MESISFHISQIDARNYTWEIVADEDSAIAFGIEAKSISAALKAAVAEHARYSAKRVKDGYPAIAEPLGVSLKCGGRFASARLGRGLASLEDSQAVADALVKILK